MEANDDSVLGRLALASHREPLWRITGPSWLAKVLLAGGAHPVHDTMVSTCGGGLTPERVPEPARGAPQLRTDRSTSSARPPPTRREAAPNDGSLTFLGFFRDEYAKIVRVVMYAGATMREAEDATANAMIEAYLSWSLLENPAAWVRVVAIHDYITSTQRSPRRPILQAPATPPARVDRDPPESGGQAGEHELVPATIGRLSLAQREVVALHLDGYHSATIAKLLGKPVSTVRSNLRHARDRLRRELDDVSA
jgi:RNA polymerase sigma-70 factor (ECF subfamily)